jgi:sensor c-di-GMP phosphodiesterase-like protein
MKKKAAAQIGFEFLSIVFAVLLALGLNSYKQNMDLEDEGRLLRARIITECKRNLSELDSVIVENEEFLTYVDSLKQLDEMKISGFSISIASELLTKSAWTFTQASRSFSYMDEAFLNDASILYEQQDYYMTISNQMFEKLGDMLMLDSDADKMVNLIHYYLSNLNATSRQLKKTYTEFLEEYNINKS